ncbi:1,4-dihydroxy-2-naphthoate polyprenyltransferase [Corynebacterium sp. MNWGS58]|uniref:1,4-dihydroxy-2-naphthoate polyprenyltransferase n=1 Tax=Corynebacterium sp. 102791.4 TaxID=3104612 RepID=UPI0035195D21
MSATTYSATPRDWIQAARPHTWPNAFAPVLAGTGAAMYQNSGGFFAFLLALIVAWALVIGVNYANDYSDGIRGTDDERTGPTRLTASKLARPAAVKKAAFISFGVAGVAGLILALLSAWWLLLVGAFCLAGAWFYTGGKRPYGYRGLGEVAIFIFFGLIAVLGTEYTQAGAVSELGIVLAISVGAMSSAVNLTNNIRDIATDKPAGKRTLAVILGDSLSRKLYTVLLIVPYIVTFLVGVFAFPATWIAFISGYWALKALHRVHSGARGVELIAVLALTGRTMALWSVLMFAALALA